MEMPSRPELMERFNIISRANSFLKSRNLKCLDENIKIEIPNTIFNHFFNVAPITTSQLDRLYFHTVYISVKINNFVRVIEQ